MAASDTRGISMAERVDAIIFDFFEVLSIRTHQKFLEKYVPDFSERQQEFVELGKQADKGLISLEAYEQQIADAAGTSIEEYRKYNHSSREINKQLLEYIVRELKPHYKIGMLSNAGKDLLSFASGEHLEDIFDAITISAEIGAIKPEPRAFQAACEQLGVEPIHAIMIDDLADNCTGARALGMKAVQYRNFKQAVGDLRQLLGSHRATGDKNAHAVWIRAARLSITAVNNARQELRAEGRASGAAEVVAKAHRNLLHAVWHMSAHEPAVERVATQIAGLMTAMPHVADVNRQKIALRYDHEMQVRLRKPLSYFNHDMAAVLANMTPEMAADFIDNLFKQSHLLLDELNLPVLPREELESIGRGVAGEAAFAQALVANGWGVVHGSVEEDLHGIDLTAETPFGTVFFDPKRQRSFMHTLIELSQDHLLPRSQQQRAAEQGFARVTYNHRTEPYVVYVVNADHWGAIDQYYYHDLSAAARRIGSFVNQIRRHH